MSDTKFDADPIRELANKFSTIMDDMGPFDALIPHWPDAGTFTTAQWLERVVDDRRNGLVEHTQRLKLICNELDTVLHRIATDLENTDKDNAATILREVDQLRSQDRAKIASLDKGTEAEQHNFGPPDHGIKNNRSDGDGWNDVLPGGSDT